MNIGMLVHPYSQTAPGGLGRANAQLSHAIATASPTDTFTFYVKGDDPAVGALTGPNWAVKLLGTGPSWLTGSFLMNKTHDAYIFFTPIIPLFLKPKKSIVVALDFAFLEVAPRTFKEWITTKMLYLLQNRSLAISTRIVAISQATKDSAMHHFHIAPEKIDVVHIGFMPLPAEGSAMPVPARFVLFAGVLKERKNVLNVIRAFALFHKTHSDVSLVIAGRTEGSYYQSLVSIVQELGIGTSVHFVGYVTNEELAYLYTKAEALVFPSLIEGFGMPVLEAMEKGLPVVTSNDGSLAEIAGDAAELVDPRSPDDIALGIAHVIDNPVLRTEYSTRGRARAAQFSWEKAGKQVLILVKSF